MNIILNSVPTYELQTMRLGLLIILLSSCSVLNGTWQTRKEMNKFLDKGDHNLLSSYGLPCNTVSDGESGQVWVYIQNTYEPPSEESVTQKSHKYLEYKVYYINKDGIVYRWLYLKEDTLQQGIQNLTSKILNHSKQL